MAYSQGPYYSPGYPQYGSPAAPVAYAPQYGSPAPPVAYTPQYGSPVPPVAYAPQFQQGPQFQPASSGVYGPQAPSGRYLGYNKFRSNIKNHMGNTKKKIHDRYNKMSPRSKKVLKYLGYLIVLIIIMLIFYFGIYPYVKSKMSFVPHRDDMENNNLKPTYNLKIKDNKGTGLTLEHGSSNSSGDSVKAYPNSIEGAKLWVYNPNDYTLCSSVDGLCLYNETNNSSVVVKRKQSNNPNFSWNVDFDNSKIVKKNTNMVLDNPHDNNISVIPNSKSLSQMWSLEVQ